MLKYNAIIVGAGHNGLIAANYLKSKMNKVLVLEARNIVGGAATTEELIPGFKFSRFSYVCSLLRP
jgi:phytoene dehydrogenase-like protein